MKKIIRARALTGAAMALSVAATMAPAAFGGSGAHAATPVGSAAIPFHQKFSADLQGDLLTVKGSVGSALFGNLFSGEFTIGKSENALDSQGVKTLDATSEGIPAGTVVGTRSELATAAIAGQAWHFEHGMSTAPIASSEPSSLTGLPLNVPPLIDGAVLSGTSQAHWNNGYLLKKTGARRLVGGNTSLGSVKLLDGSQLAGPLSSFLPATVQGGLLGVNSPAATSSISTTRNSTGTHGLKATVTSRLGEINILGGAQAGGVTLGLGTADSGADAPVAGVTLWANGKPGGAGCSYVRPSILKVAYGSTNLELPLSAGSRITIPGGLGYIDYSFAGLASCNAAADGTSVTATGGGLGLHVVLQIPGLGGLADFQVGLINLDKASVSVPAGGIKGTDWDSDHDGLPDLKELNVYHTNPHRKDTDRDGLTDGQEVKKYHTNPRKKDTDRDGLTDGQEVKKYHTNPRKKDTDRDGLTDGQEVKKYHTNPRKKDTDGDGVSDGAEVRHHTNLRNRHSH